MSEEEDRNILRDTRDESNRNPDVNFDMELPEEVLDKGIWSRLSLYQLIYSLCGLMLGAVCVLAGVFLFLKGISGSSNFTGRFLGAETAIDDAAPGALLFVVGLLIVWVTRFFVRVSKKAK